MRLREPHATGLVSTGAPGGCELRASGAFFGWVRHPFTPSDERYLRFSVAALEDANSANRAHDYGAFGEARGSA
ncbi:hypothetical protein ACFVGY_02370 [Streptomyces sp. NPDC127106]|uniref:hypothetical protein n=1 Tax=Streptomyces sp. NPDC127106 TaxID=3345360 RepID=UPI0036270705